MRLFFWLWIFFVLPVTFLVAFCFSVSAHDIYTTLQSPTGQLCCGGNDCEAVTYKILPSGDAIMDSKRHGAPILIAKAKITWMAVPGGEYSEAHWCGASRKTVVLAPINADNPDPSFWTYCAFIAPGGV